MIKVKIRRGLACDATTLIAFPHLQFHPTRNHSIVVQLMGYYWSTVIVLTSESQLEPEHLATTRLLIQESSKSNSPLYTHIPERIFS